MPSWAQTGAVGEACLKRWLNVSSRLGKFMHWHVTKAQANKLRFGGKTITVQDAAEFDWTQAQLAFFVAGKEATAAWLKKRPTQVAW